MTPEELAAVRARADAHPEDVDALCAAAFACDRWGREEDAIVYYEAAWQLGGPAHDQAGFLVGLGSTLRNVGRLEEAVDVLRDACVRHPLDQALRTFLGLALHSAGRHAEAAATFTDAVLMSPSPEVVRYARALAYYRDELRR